jgi:hypothetical protein
VCSHPLNHTFPRPAPDLLVHTSDLPWHTPHSDHTKLTPYLDHMFVFFSVNHFYLFEAKERILQNNWRFRGIRTYVHASFFSLRYSLGCIYPGGRLDGRKCLSGFLLCVECIKLPYVGRGMGWLGERFSCEDAEGENNSKSNRKFSSDQMKCVPYAYAGTVNYSNATFRIFSPSLCLFGSVLFFTHALGRNPAWAWLEPYTRGPCHTRAS